MGRVSQALSRLSCLGLAAGALLGLGACRLPQARQAGEVQAVLHRAEKSVRAKVSADGRQLGLRFSLRGDDAFAVAGLTSTTPAPLTFQPDHAAYSAVLGKKPTPVPVFGPAVWRKMSETLALRLAPDAPDQGNLIMAGGRELIAHRVNGKGVLTVLHQRPRRLKIVRKTSASALAEEIFTDRGDALDRPGGRDGPALMLTGTFPEVVYLDRRARRLVFFTVPAEEATGLPLVPVESGKNMLRQLTSFVWRSNVLAVLKNPYSTASRVVASGGSIASAGVGRLLSRLPQGPPPPLANRPEMDLKAWTEELSGIASAPASQAALRIRLGGDEFFPDFIQAVQEARRMVDVQIYIFDNDDYAVSIADLLKKRSRENVRVRVLLDESGSLAAAASPPESPMPAHFTPPANMPRYLRQQSGVQVRPMPMSGLSASHTKIITVDNEIAWLGGMNIGREYRYDWHDLMIEARGPLVAWIRQDFVRAWARHGPGGDYAVAWRNWTSPTRQPSTVPAPPGSVAVQPLYTSSRKSEIVDAQIAALRRSQSRVWVENAYLSDGAFIAELIAARHRGVDVRVVFPAENDNGIMAANNRALVPLLRRHGIRVFLLPGMSHVKAALYDGWACVGSANFDRLSLRVNNEFSIGCSDPSFTGDLRRRLFETDFKRSREVTGQPQPAPADEFMNALIRSIAGQL